MHTGMDVGYSFVSRVWCRRKSTWVEDRSSDDRETGSVAHTCLCGDRDAVRGNVIEAIKLVRVERNVGLKDAKDLVDATVSAPGYCSAKISEGGCPP